MYIKTKQIKIMKNNIKLTSVNILVDVYAQFKKGTLETDMNLQKLVNRCVDLYSKDDRFKDQVDNHKTLGIKNSKF